MCSLNAVSKKNSHHHQICCALNGHLGQTSCCDQSPNRKRLFHLFRTEVKRSVSCRDLPVWL